MEDTVLVTGASSGIGREIAHEAAADGHPVALTARREAELRDAVDEIREEHGVEEGTGYLPF